MFNITKTTYISYNTVHNFHKLVSQHYKNTPLNIVNSLSNLCILRNLGYSSYMCVFVGWDTLIPDSLYNMLLFNNMIGNCRHILHMCYLLRMNGHHNLYTKMSMYMIGNVLGIVYTRVCMYSVRNKSCNHNKSFYHMNIEYIVFACIIKLVDNFLLWDCIDNLMRKLYIL